MTETLGISIAGKISGTSTIIYCGLRMIMVFGLRMKAVLGGGVVGAYFTNIFTTLNPFGFVDVHNGVPPIVTVEMDLGLLQPYTAKEVQKVLTQMAPLT